MYKLMGILFAWVCLLSTAQVKGDELVWQKGISSDGTAQEFDGLIVGETYYIKASGYVGFGTDFKTGNPLTVDSCFEYTSQAAPVSLPILTNSLGISICQGGYQESHVYQSLNFQASGTKISFSIADTDYRDNSGMISVEIYHVQPAVTQPEVQLNFDAGYFVVLELFFPEVPSNLPEGTKPSDYLKKLDPKTAKLVASGSNLVVYVPDASSFKMSDFSTGKKYSAKAQMHFDPMPQKAATDVKGVIAMEVRGTFDTLADLIKAYPDMATPTKQATIAMMDENGKITQKDKNELASSTLEATSLQEGWVDDDIEDVIAYATGVYEYYGCFVATAVYESFAAPELTVLREFRDTILKKSAAGEHLITLYYFIGPHWAKTVAESDWIKMALKPFLSAFVWTLEMVDMNNPTTQSFLTTMTEWVDWIIGPWMEQEKVELGEKPFTAPRMIPGTL